MAKRLHLDEFMWEGRRLLRYREAQNLGLLNLLTTKDWNLGLKEEDLLSQEYQSLLRALGRPQGNLWFLNQQHTDQSLWVQKDTPCQKKAGCSYVEGLDGLITKDRSMVLSTQFADCVPLLIYDPAKKVLANVHSGWKGTLLGIGGRVVKRLQEQWDSEVEDLQIFVGPHIQWPDFQVRADVRQAFLFRWGETLPYLSEGTYLRPVDQEHWVLSLRRVLESMFLGLGVLPEHLYVAEESTVARGDLLHSFRRDKKDFGLMSILAALP
ncbi:hypothetical protein ABB02_01345 [Clostridiaceae bacterium JG1575]|nr:hypothetical protein ABB02_01345 [Clostridiaceae bacterium JG1575]